MRYNILVIIIDCLRFDRVTPNYMPHLHKIAEDNFFFTNYWSTSHCTDPAITSMLTGKWPDELRLYSMMFGTPWELPSNVEMLAEVAQRNGYVCAMISNLARWYKRGLDYYEDNRNWHGLETFNRAFSMVRKELKEPWFLVIHDDSCHSNYRGGSYDRACQEVDLDIARMVGLVRGTNTFVVITSDHGEGLGERGIDMHGFGLWPFLTRVPLIIQVPFGGEHGMIWQDSNENLVQPIQLYELFWQLISHSSTFIKPITYAHMVGRTPRFWHRAITDGEKMVIKEQNAKTGATMYTHFDVRTDQIMGRSTQPVFLMWDEARKHAAQFGINADDDRLDDKVLEDRLRNLGYFD